MNNTKNVKNLLWLEIAGKNVKSIFRDKRGFLFLILIPIFFYTLMGLLFGNNMNETQGYAYRVGFIDLDTTAASDQRYPNHNLTVIYETFASIDSIDVIFYDDEMVAREDLSKKNLDVALIFHDGFETALSESSVKRYAVYDNDTTTHAPANVTHSVDLFINVSSSFINVTNVSGQPLPSVFSSFNVSQFDYLVVFEEGFEEKLDSGIPAPVAIHYRDGTSEAEVEAQAGFISGTIANIVGGPSAVQVAMHVHAVPGSSPKPGPRVDILYRDSTEMVTRQVISATIAGILDGIVNYDLSRIDIEFKEDNVSGEIKNAITLSAPGYVMYGMLMTLSIAVIMFTNEKKTGNMKRLESTMMSATDMLTGHVLSNTTVLFIQFAIGIGVMAIFGFTIFPADLLSLVLGVFLTVTLTSLFINALALLSGVIFKTPDAAAGGVWIFLIPLMTFSGAFFPIELVAPSLVDIARWVPTRITVLLLQDIMVNGVSLLSPDIWFNLAIMTASGLALLLAGVKLYGRFARSTP